MSGSRGWRFGHEIPGLLHPDQSLPIDERLVVIERADAYFVTVAGSDVDWLACFERAEGIDAEGWAENMALIYNRRFTACRQRAFETGDAAAGQDAQSRVGEPSGADRATRTQDESSTALHATDSQPR